MYIAFPIIWHFFTLDTKQDSYFQEIQVDFEARTPEDSDFHGIRKLLQQVNMMVDLSCSSFNNLKIRNSDEKQLSDTVDLHIFTNWQHLQHLIVCNLQK